MNDTIKLIGYGCGLGAGNDGCKEAAKVIKEQKILEQCQATTQWQTILTPEHEENKLHAIAQLSEKLAQVTYELTQLKQKFAVIGGDHSSAIGTWSGCAKALDGPLGLIWSDAHLDAHTFDTTPSQNIHGMPVAALLGHGDPSLTQVGQQSPSLKPENICFIGIRDYETEEHELLKTLGVRMIDHHELHERGLENCLNEAISIATHNTTAYGMSIDLDGFDPSFAPAVGTPVPNGINPHAFCHYFETNSIPMPSGIEIVEYNPSLDKNFQTADIIKNLVDAIYLK